MQNLFLKAARNKFRFKTAKGSLNTEQLFELTKKELNDLYVELEGTVKRSSGLLGKTGNTEVEEKMEIVKDVFDTIVAEQERKKELANNKALKQTVLQTIEEKKVGALKEKSLEELQKLAQELQSNE